MKRTLPILVLLAVSLLIILALPVANADPTELRIIALKHRPAEEIIPIIRPLLNPGDAISGTHFQLFVRTSNAQFHAIEHLLSSIDTPQRNLYITVKQSVARNAKEINTQIHGQTPLGGHGVIVLGNTGHGATLNEDVRSDQDLSYGLGQKSSAGQTSYLQTLTVLEGRAAFISIGQSLPYVSQFLALAQDHLIATSGVSYQDVTTGFTVLAQVQGNQVQLQIAPRLTFLGDHGTDIVNFLELSTTVIVKPGEWLDLGTVIGMENQTSQAILASASSNRHEHKMVLIKVDLSR